MSRPRRDPRLAREAMRVAGDARPRFDRTSTAGFQPVETAKRQQLAIIVENPEFWVVAVADRGISDLNPVDRQVLGAARALAGKSGGVVLIAERPVDGAGAAGADRVCVLPPDIHPQARAESLIAAIRTLEPRHIIVAETLDGGDLARRLAVALNLPFFANAEQVSERGLVRGLPAQRVEQVAQTPPAIITIAPDMVPPYAADQREARPLPAPTSTCSEWQAEMLPLDTGQLPLTEADFVASAGNGIVDFDLFRQLAAALKATPGASRVVCDAGLMPREAQVGASGTVLAAGCYLALGIAGAPQHLQGIADCQHVIAVNTDLHAAMIARADLAIVGDAHPIMVALLSLLAEEDA
ncbi:electron transfer flavoprotein subunit alpha/FixB family protein [Aureimonas fodinaquatilis]|uniref:Electron transfer flavoprotein subunit alpha/FixB family protein n=1 Tax=Aureimonas fodinaquatilis TaxID=2565783 RepID=A0A5B0E529_9HYPH|nr:electron transfer flavoprotein subunit alpha/FixB family protein [Aureimonas fodinaquatilis]KAA0972539.1 electron transfer flavoprotein subunit alpha/FixB family protein [Aureimonas fodinaquatilis]